MHAPTATIEVQHHLLPYLLDALSSTLSSSEVLEELSLWLEELDVSDSSAHPHFQTHLNVSTVVDDELVPLEGLVVGSVERGETPLLGDDDLLPSRELVSGTSESLHDDGPVDVFASDGHDDLTTGD